MNDHLKIVCAHGMFCNAQFFNSLIRELENIVPIEAFDLSNHGSRKGELFFSKQPVAFADYVRDICKAVAHGPTIVLGHSLGALAALSAKQQRFQITENIRAIVTVNSSCPKGIDLPFSVKRRMIAPRYIRAVLMAYKCSRFTISKRHARKFMLNKTDSWFDTYKKFESESGLVLRELIKGIPLDGEVENVHMYSFREDRIATSSMQGRLAERIGAKEFITLPRLDHMGINSLLFIERMKQDLPKLVEKYS